MREIVDIPSLETNATSLHEEMKQQVKDGLTQTAKMIPAKYLYDDRGCDLFNQITREDEYYLTNSELEILSANKRILAEMLADEPLNLIDLGPGEGFKTEILMQEFVAHGVKFSYMPIDISETYLKNLINKFTPQFPALSFLALHADFFTGLDWIHQHSKQRNFLLFLGSSIGNFTPEETLSFLKQLHRTLNPQDYLLFGFDLCKDIDRLMRAYDDCHGITREFNFNLLHRLNRELQTHFDISTFRHYPTYNVNSRAMESYLISQKKQTIYCDELNCDFNFEYMEPIHVESSYKYQVEQIQVLAAQAGFKVVANFFDTRRYFLDSLWCKTSIQSNCNTS